MAAAPRGSDAQTGTKPLLQTGPSYANTIGVMRALADWRSPTDYPSPGPETLLARWHWEFLRRNGDYQRDYERFAGLSPQDSEQAKERIRLAARYGLDGLMFDYREPLELLFESPRPADAVRMVRWETRFAEDEQGNVLETAIEDLDYLTPNLKQHECCVVFNLRESVDAQIEAAKKRLEKEYRRFAARRGRIDQYPFYLRLLDGDADGVGTAELAEYFFPEVEARIGRRRIDNALDEAILLRDVNFRYI